MSDFRKFIATTIREYLNESVKTNLTPDLYNLVRSEEFKKWFGDWENDRENSSKVLDENGEDKTNYIAHKNLLN